MFLKKGKKSRILQVAAVLLAFAVAIGFVACPGDKVGGGEPVDPTVADFDISGVTTVLKNSTINVTITAKDGKDAGAITIHYEGTDGTTLTKSTTKPSTASAGKYAVTFDVAGGADFNAKAGLAAGTLTVLDSDTLLDPVAADFDITGTEVAFDGQPKAVTITPKQGKSEGQITIYYEGTGGTTYAKSTTAPSAAGKYTITFDVAAKDAYNAATGLAGGTLDIEDASAPATNYVTGPDALDWGLSASADVRTLGLTVGSDTTEIRLTWYSEGAISGKVAKVRFVHGTFEAAYHLIETEGDETLDGATSREDGGVKTATTGFTTHKVVVEDLVPGNSYQYAVTSDGDNWTEAYEYKVPAATGGFKFGVIADPQLNTVTDATTSTATDVNSRYPNDTLNSGITSLPAGIKLNAGNATIGVRSTAAGWLETMTILKAKGVSFIASGGDQVDYSGSGATREAEYDYLFAPPEMKSIPLAPVAGNHDTHMGFNYHYNMPNRMMTYSGGLGVTETVPAEIGRNYYYLYNNILFVVLNTAPYPGNRAAAIPIVNRFDDTLEAATTQYTGKYKWLIVQHHKSTASVADHCADNDIQYYVEAGFETVMSKYNVDFVLAGHDHVYARSYPLEGKDNGQVSVPDKTLADTGSDEHSYTNPGKPIYLTFTTGSGIKYYAVRADKTFPYFAPNAAGTLYEKANATYPYLGDVTDADGTSSTMFGSTQYIDLSGTYGTPLPVSNAAYVQPYIPSYCIAEMSADGTTLKFSTYPIATATGTSVVGGSTAEAAYDFKADEAYDWVQVKKTN